MAFNLPGMQDRMERAWGLHQRGPPAWQKKILQTAMPVLMFFVQSLAGTENKAAVEESKEAVEKQLKEVDELVPKKQKTCTSL